MHFLIEFKIRFFEADGRECVLNFKNSESGWGLRRTDLSESLFESAKSAGVSLNEKTRFISITEDGSALISQRSQEIKLTYDFLVGADGIRSKVAQSVGIAKQSFKGINRHSWRQHFFCKPWSPYVEVYWGKGFEAYVTPLSDQLLQVAGIFSGSVESKDLWMSRVFRSFPDLKEKIGSSQPASIPLASGPTQGYAQVASQGNAVLVGDAYAFWDGISGEGMSLAFTQGELAAQFIGGTISRQELNRKYYDLFIRYRNKTALMFLFGKNDWTKLAGFSFIKTFPKLAAGFL